MRRAGARRPARRGSPPSRIATTEPFGKSTRARDSRTRATIIATNAAGQPVDTFNLANYRIMSANTNPRESSDTYRSARINARREFGREIPVAIKVGADIRQNARDIRADVNGNGPGAWTFI